VENSRYSKDKGTVKLTSEQLFDISQEIRGKFKHSLANDVTELILLPVDPYHLHAHWTIDAEEIDNPNVKGGSNELVLQFYWDKQQSINQNVSKHFSVNVDFSQSQQNIRLPVDNSYYSAVLGVLDHNQQLTVLAKSNTVHVPRAKSLPKIQKPIKSRPINKAIALVENKNQLTTIVSEKVYDEVKTDAQIKAILLKYYPQRKVDQLLQTFSINTDLGIMPVHGVYDEIVINVLIQRVLQQQGKDSQLVNDVLRLESHFAASNLSGQNFYF
jgi:hypothetical protein